MIPAMRNAHATHVDFGFLRGIIRDNPNFMPSNIDMVLERKSSFLFGEWKREDEEMKQGQKMLLKELAWVHKVIIITGYVDTQPHISLIQQVLPIHYHQQEQVLLYPLLELLRGMQHTQALQRSQQVLQVVTVLLQQPIL